MSKNISLWIDADNTSAKDFPYVVKELSKYGKIIHRYIYGNWQKTCLHPWIEAGRIHAGQFHQVFDVATLKNASDISIVVDIMSELEIYSNNIIAIMSSDSDFTPLIRYLKRNNIETIGIGKSNCSSILQNSFSMFIHLPKQQITTNSYPNDECKRLVEAAKEIGAEYSYISIGILGSNLKGKLTYSKGTLGTLLAKYPEYFIISNNSLKLR